MATGMKTAAKKPQAEQPAQEAGAAHSAEGQNAAAQGRNAEPPKPETPDQKPKDDISSTVGGPLSAWYEYIKLNAAHCYVGLLRIAIASWLATVVFCIVTVAAMAALLAAAIGGGALALLASGQLGTLLAALTAPVLALLIIIPIVLMILLSWVQTVIGLTRLTFAEAELTGKQFSIRQSAWELKRVALRFLLLDSAMRLVLSLPAIALISLAVACIFVAGPLVGWIAVLLATLLAGAYCFAAFAVYGFVTQFWAYGFVLGGMGVRESLAKGLSLVRNRLIEAFAMGLVLWVGAMVLALPLAVFGIASGLVELVLRLAAGIPGVGTAILGIYIIYRIIDVLVSMALGVIPMVLGVPAHYLFWKRVSR